VTQREKRIFGKNLRQARRERGLAQREIAAMSGFNRSTLGSVERTGKNFAVVEMERIALVVGKSVADLLLETPEPLRRARVKT
jgi:transcriptional regulator with XRE-family HTH domain